jgi:aryl-alcohol dehydrogenase-like predicted oxidoreductase
VVSAETLPRRGRGRFLGSGAAAPFGALAVLREVVKLGINHIDSSDFYGPHITNQLIKEALHPYPEKLRIVTKVGACGTRKEIGPKRLLPISSTRRFMTTSLTVLAETRSDRQRLGERSGFSV